MIIPFQINVHGNGLKLNIYSQSESIFVSHVLNTIPSFVVNSVEMLATLNTTYSGKLTRKLKIRLKIGQNQIGFDWKQSGLKACSVGIVCMNFSMVVCGNETHCADQITHADYSIKFGGMHICNCLCLLVAKAN